MDRFAIDSVRSTFTYPTIDAARESAATWTEGTYLVLEIATARQCGAIEVQRSRAGTTVDYRASK